MYCNDDIIHFRLNELPLVSSIVSLFSLDAAKKIDDIYSYHKFRLKENDNQPLQFTLQEKNNYLKKFYYSSCVQPEFIFSDDEDIF